MALRARRCRRLALAAPRRKRGPTLGSLAPRASPPETRPRAGRAGRAPTAGARGRRKRCPRRQRPEARPSCGRSAGPPACFADPGGRRSEPLAVLPRVRASPAARSSVLELPRPESAAACVPPEANLTRGRSPGGVRDRRDRAAARVIAYLEYNSALETLGPRPGLSSNKSKRAAL